MEEREEDKKIATLLSMKPIRSVEENLDKKRRKLLSQSSLPTSNFSRKKEETAVKMLNSGKLNLGIVRKSDKNIVNSSSNSTCISSASLTAANSEEMSNSSADEVVDRLAEQNSSNHRNNATKLENNLDLQSDDNHHCESTKRKQDNTGEGECLEAQNTTIKTSLVGDYGSSNSDSE